MLWSTHLTDKAVDVGPGGMLEEGDFEEMVKTVFKIGSSADTWWNPTINETPGSEGCHPCRVWWSGRMTERRILEFSHPEVWLSALVKTLSHYSRSKACLSWAAVMSVTYTGVP